MADPNNTCPEAPSSFNTILCHACRLICKYPTSMTIHTYATDSLKAVVVDLSLIPVRCPNYRHDWNTSTAWTPGLPPDQQPEEFCQMCHVEFYTPALVCWTCTDEFVERWDLEDLGCDVCGMKCDSSWESGWVRRDVEYDVDDIPYVNLDNDGRLEYLDEVEDAMIARRREVEKRKRGVRSHLQN